MIDAFVEVVGTLAVIFLVIVVPLLVMGALFNSKVEPPAVPVSSARRTEVRSPARAPRGSGRTTEEPHRIRYIENSAQPRVHCWCGDVSQPLPDVAACLAWMLAHTQINAWLDSARRDVEWSASIDNTRRQA